MIRVVYIDPNHVHGQTGYDQWFIGYTGPPTRKPSGVDVSTQAYGWLQHNPSIDVSLPLDAVLEQDGVSPVLEESGEVVTEE